MLKEKLITKYTAAAFKQLYNEELKVYFRNIGYLAIFRNKEVGPAGLNIKIASWDKEKEQNEN